jgi:hypothetical protein
MPRMRRFAGVLLAIPLTLAAVGAAAEVQRTAAPPGAKVYFIQPTDGSTVPQTFTVKFGLENMGVAPAGTDKPATGHHHLLIDRDLPPLDQPMGGDIMHFGGGQTEAQVTLPPGTHTLQLLLGDMNHVPHDPPIYSDKITITVQ